MQDDEDLLHLVDSGFEIESVAWALNRSPGTVRARLALLHRDAPAVGQCLQPVLADGLPSDPNVDA